MFKRFENVDSTRPFGRLIFPRAKQLRSVIQGLHHLFYQDKYLSEVFSALPIVSFHQPHAKHNANLRHKRVPSRLLTNDTDSTSSSVPCAASGGVISDLVCSNTTINRGDITHCTFGHFNSQFVFESDENSVALIHRVLNLM